MARLGRLVADVRSLNRARLVATGKSLVNDPNGLIVKPDYLAHRAQSGDT